MTTSPRHSTSIHACTQCSGCACTFPWTTCDAGHHCSPARPQGLFCHIHVPPFSQVNAPPLALCTPARPALPMCVSPYAVPCTPRFDVTTDPNSFKPVNGKNPYSDTYITHNRSCVHNAYIHTTHPKHTHVYAQTNSFMNARTLAFGS